MDGGSIVLEWFSYLNGILILTRITGRYQVYIICFLTYRKIYTYLYICDRFKMEMECKAKVKSHHHKHRQGAPCVQGVHRVRPLRNLTFHFWLHLSLLWILKKLYLYIRHIYSSNTPSNLYPKLFTLL